MFVIDVEERPGVYENVKKNGSREFDHSGTLKVPKYWYHCVYV